MTDKIVPVALRLWLLFLFALLLVGYAIVPSILFGAVGGFAGGMVSAWWRTDGGEPKPNLEPSPVQKLGSKFAPQQIQRRIPALKLFTRRDRRYSDSRRS